MLRWQWSLRRDKNDYAYTARINADRDYTVNALNQYTASGTATLGYDARGNLNASTVSGTTAGYGYSRLNELTSALAIVLTPDSSPSRAGRGLRRAGSRRGAISASA